MIDPCLLEIRAKLIWLIIVSPFHMGHGLDVIDTKHIGVSKEVDGWWCSVFMGNMPHSLLRGDVCMDTIDDTLSNDQSGGEKRNTQQIIAFGWHLQPMLSMQSMPSQSST